jgi:thiamine biosynthesis protein ThiI
VQAETGRAVDVHKPALRIGIEVGTDVAYVFAGRQDAPGGLPVGASGRALLLLSGGIDSPVAGWLAAKRGLALDAVYFHSPPYVGEKSRDKVLALGKQLARWQALRSVTVVPFTDVQKRLRDAGPAEMAVVLYRRMMMRIADAIADQLEAAALVTGENLGQVASQTIENLTAIEAAARRVVLRPLVTYDKVETTALARRIGTYETSILPYEDCCSLFVPLHPATRARAQDAERVEAQLDVAAEIAAAVAGSERISV